MAHSVEGRFPFLDYRLVEFCNRLPATCKMRALRDKRLLRKLGRELLPDEIWNRPKKPYRAPIHRSFFNGQTQAYVRELLSEASLNEAGFFNPAAVGKLIAKIEQGMPIGETDDMALAGIISTQLLHHLFVKNFNRVAPLSEHGRHKGLRSSFAKLPCLIASFLRAHRWFTISFGKRGKISRQDGPRVRWHPLTYGEIHAMANRFANALVHSGVNRGDAVAIHLKNSVECVVGIFGTLIAGAMFVVINPTTRRDKLFYILNHCRAKVAVLDQTSEIARRILESPDALPSLRNAILCGGRPGEAVSGHGSSLHFDDIQRQFPSTDLKRTNIDLDLACLIYTSGSTGEPKGVMSDHSNVVFAAQSIMSYLKNVPEDIVINLLPLSFDYGLYQLLMTFAFGGTLILEKSFAFPAAILKRIEAERVTGFPGVPTIYSMLLQMDLSQFDLSSLRYLTNTAAALPESHIRRIRDSFPNVTLYSMYGLTETKRTLYLPPEELDRRPGSVGIPIPGTDAWVEDETGRRLGPGEIGELVVRGRHVMRGYWEAPEATAQRFRPG